MTLGTTLLICGAFVALLVIALFVIGWVLTKLAEAAERMWDDYP